jgi:N4-gp56 family major capsid protein
MMMMGSQTITNNGVSGDNQLSVEAKTAYDLNLLYRALPFLPFMTVASKRSLAKRVGNSMEVRRFEPLTVNTTPLVEGVPPAAVDLNITPITATVRQYGNVIRFTDQVDMFAIDPVIAEATTLLGENAGQTLEAVVRAEVVTGTTVNYGTGSTRVAQSASNPLTLRMIRKAVNQLRRNNAMPSNGMRDNNGIATGYIGIMHPDIYNDLQNDTTLTNTFTYSDKEQIYKFNAVEFGGVNFLISNFAPVFTGAGAGGVDVYGTLIFGKEAFMVVDPAGAGKPQTYVKPVGSAGAADPLDQQSTVGWKLTMATKVLNNNFMVRIETGSNWAA